MESSSRLMVFLGLSFTGLTAAIVYLLLRKEEETDYENEGGVLSARRTVIKMKVPNDLMSTIIGRGGCNVKAIQDKSGARVKCDDQSANEKFRVVTISGSTEAAQLAESLIHEIIMNQPLIISHEMMVPARACGRIIGRGGETIKAITRTSCAKIMVDSAGDAGEATERRILIKGTAEQIASAQALIEEKVKEDNDVRHHIDMSSSSRSPRREYRDEWKYLMAPSSESDYSEQEKPLACRVEKFSSLGSGGSVDFDVFVSALENPGQFWVQLLGPRGVELDQLVDQMTEFYSDPTNRELHVLHEVNVGQIVAAPFNNDDKWYRAEVVKVDEDEYNSDESEVHLYYGDYGDTGVVKRKDIFDLRTDFLALYFQAIECMLAHVKPCGEQWSEKATDLFEELAAVAQWRKKLAHVVTYRDSANKKGLRAGSPVPVVELHDVEKGINIGDELVKQGLAVWDNPQFEDADDNPNANRFGSHETVSSLTSASSARSQLTSGSNDTESLSKATNLNTRDPKTLTPASIFAMNSSTQSKSPSQSSSSSSSFIKQEQSQKKPSGFKPRTLDIPKKKPATATREASAAVVLPELVSDDDSDGFVLE